MIRKILRPIVPLVLLVSMICSAAFSAQADRRAALYDPAANLEQPAASLAQDSFEHFKSWNGTISDQEQAILFKSEAFAASCRLFLKLAEARSGYFRQDFVRTNIYNAFTYLCPARQPIRRLEQSL